MIHTAGRFLAEKVMSVEVYSWQDAISIYEPESSLLLLRACSAVLNCFFGVAHILAQRSAGSKFRRRTREMRGE